ncbi:MULTISPECIES: PepSY domain-containing protein [unclassified Rhizobium]|uniref:PepSY domain-containing protein n=1 Tax=unclassified Rhizobium TaxID=2613769 RepID=UPI001602A87C|nr:MULTISPECIES: hypothetical protein [unclassified Rhizobium]MBB1248464.1 hypothetical protein [Rhizobium sp. G21]MCV3766606.1 hypothetical protein [Rhizobium sp. TRM95796]
MLARRDLLLLLLGMAAAWAGPARADDGGGKGGDGHDGGDDHGGDDGGDDHGDDDGDGKNGNRAGLSHDDARQERLKGEVMPLSRALKLVESKMEGDVIDVRLSKGMRGYFYRFKIRDDAGVIRTLRIDARSGRVLSLLGS